MRFQGNYVTVIKMVKKIPYSKSIKLEGLDIVKSETIRIPLKGLRLSKKEKLKIQLEKKELANKISNEIDTTTFVRKIV